MAGGNRISRKSVRAQKIGTGYEWTTQELCKAFGISTSTVRNSKYPVKHKEGKNNVFDSVAAVDHYSNKQLKIGTKEYFEDKEDWNKLHKKFQAEHVEIKNAILKGQHVPISVVEEFNSEIVSIAKARFESIPSSMASLLANRDARFIKKKLTEAIQNVLEEMSGSFAQARYSSTEYIELLDACTEEEDL